MCFNEAEQNIQAHRNQSITKDKQSKYIYFAEFKST